MTKKIIFLLTYLYLLSIVAFSQTIIPKRAGISFRMDDNNSIVKYEEYLDKFNKYGFKAGLALNFANDPMWSNDSGPNSYINSIKSFQANGHEIMDHTPDHRTNFFTARLDTIAYDGLPGVDHRVGRKICLEFAEPIIGNHINTGLCNISGDTITIVAPPPDPRNGSAIFNPGDTGPNVGYYIYIPSLQISSKLFLMGWRIQDTTVIIPIFNEDNEIERYDTLTVSKVVGVTNVWNEPVNVTRQDSVQYYLFSTSGVRLTIDALRVLGNETRKLADYYGIERPTTWIQPGVSFRQENRGVNNIIFPTLNRADLKAALTTLGYTAGATYTSAFQREAVLTFTEYDPNQDAQFGMQWTSLPDETYGLDVMKFIIANRISLNKVTISGGHGNPIAGWNNYLTKLDSLFAWCQRNDIPVKTYKQWANILYNDDSIIPDPYQNIFPRINVDLNQNGYPDGYNSQTGSWTNSISDGVTFLTNDGAPGSGGKSYQIATTGGWDLIHVDNTHFTGFEKGLQDLEIWIKGASSNQFRLIFFFYEEDDLWQVNEMEWEFDLDSTSYWRRYTIDQFNPPTLNIDSNIKSAQLVVIPGSSRTGPISVSTIKMQKKGPSLNLTAFLEGAYDSTNNNMRNTLRSLGSIPTYQPFSSAPWNFNGDTLITNILAIPSNTVDWVLVELRDKNNSAVIIDRKAGLLLQNGSIVDPNGVSPLTFQVFEDDYYIYIRHRNHLMIKSANPVHLIPGFVRDYNLSIADSSVGSKIIDTSPVRWGMVAGDADGNGQIQNSDNEDFIELQSGQSGYRSADINLDNNINAADNNLWQENNGRGVQ